MKSLLIVVLIAIIGAAIGAGFLSGKLAESVAVAKHKRKRGITGPVPYMDAPESREEAERILYSPAVGDLADYSIHYAKVHFVSSCIAMSLLACLFFFAIYRIDDLDLSNPLLLIGPCGVITLQVIICVIGCASARTLRNDYPRKMSRLVCDTQWIRTATDFVRSYNDFVDTLNAHP